jgi:hypothetical protein
MDAVWIVVIAGVVLVGLAAIAVVAGSGRARRLAESEAGAEELRREAEFHDVRAERARIEAEESVARAERGGRFVRGGQEEEQPEPEPDPSEERRPG